MVGWPVSISGSHHLAAPQCSPPTFQRGRKPIDGIFVAPQLFDIALGGYLSFDKAMPSNHWVIWLDLHIPQVCPQNQEPYSKPAARRLKCKDPQVLARYNAALMDTLTKNNIMQRVTELKMILQGPTDL